MFARSHVSNRSIALKKRSHEPEVRARPLATEGGGAFGGTQICFVPSEIVLCPQKFVSNIMQPKILLS